MQWSLGPFVFCVLMCNLFVEATAAQEFREQLIAAHQMGELGTLQLLCDIHKLMVPDEQGQTLLHTAAKEGDTTLARALLAVGLHVNMYNATGLTPLMLASEAGHAKVVRLLLEHGAPVDQASSNGWTALMMAARHGHVEVVWQLCNSGASTNAVTQKGFTALHFAACHGNHTAIEILLAFKANPNLIRDDGYSPLLLAVDRSRSESVSMLLAAGAAVNQVTAKRGKTALQLAACRQHSELARMLLLAGAGPDYVNSCKESVMQSLIAGHSDDKDKLLKRKQCFARILFKRGLSNYTQEQLNALGLCREEVCSIIAQLQGAFKSFCQASAQDIRGYDCFPDDICHYIGLFIGGALAH